MDTPGVPAPASAATDRIALLYARHRRSLLRLASRILHDTADAEDVVQEAFLRLMQGIEDRSVGGRVVVRHRGGCHPRNEQDGPMTCWLFHTVTRLAIDMIRREPRRAGSESAYYRFVVPRPLDPARQRDRARVIERVWRVLGRLSKRTRLLLFLCAAGKTHDEIASAVGIVVPATLRKALTRARRAFRVEYGMQLAAERVGRAGSMGTIPMDRGLIQEGTEKRRRARRHRSWKQVHSMASRG